jgi:dTDP-4-dehydrorhamnose reductase
VKRVLLFGGNGQLGTAIRERWTQCEIVAPSHHALPIEDGNRLRDAIAAGRPDVVVNAAAFHEVDRCEEEPGKAFEINALAVRRAARLADDAGAAFVTISTDYVFDGKARIPYREDDAPHPLSVYAASKLAGEYLVEALGTRAYVIRTCGLYGWGGANARRSFIERLLGRANDSEPVTVVSDVVASPTFAGHLADTIERLLETERYGLYHAVDAGPVSWYDFALEAVRQAGTDVAIAPIPARQWKAPAIRPRYSALDNVKLGELGIAMPSWRDGIAAYLASRPPNRSSLR